VISDSLTWLDAFPHYSLPPRTYFPPVFNAMAVKLAVRFGVPRPRSELAKKGLRVAAVYDAL
jgi:hypothetical protein